MKLETHAKIGIWAGIASLVIVVPFLVLMQYSFLYNEFGAMFVDQDGMVEEFKTFESYLLFQEKYPENYEKIRKDRGGSVYYEVFAYNFDTGNRLELNLRYDAYDNEIRENANCDMQLNTYRTQLGTNQAYALASSGDGFSSSVPQIFFRDGHAQDEFVIDFIKYTNCLEITKQKPESHN
jgi:hypothetical protein